MSVRLIAPPVEEPVTLQEAKAHSASPPGRNDEDSRFAAEGGYEPGAFRGTEAALDGAEEASARRWKDIRYGNLGVSKRGRIANSLHKLPAAQFVLPLAQAPRTRDSDYPELVIQCIYVISGRLYD